MANPFDDPNFGKASNPFDDPNFGKTSLARRALADPLVSLAKGVVSVPEAIVGLADIPTGGAVGRGAEAVGIRFKDAKGALDELYSPEQQAVNKGLQDTKGFLPTIGYALSNPSTIGHAVLESAPSMIGGAAIGRAALAAGMKSMPLAAGIGEGAFAAGASAEHIRQQTPDGSLSPAQALLAAGSGIATGALGFAGGKIAQSAVGKKLGLTDLDTALVGGKLAAPGTAGVAKRVGGGFVSEGLLEELPQSAQEQVAQNLALGKPWDEGVAEAAAMGGLVGGVMGGGANVLSGRAAAPTVQPAAAPADAPVEPGVDTPPATVPQSAAAPVESAAAPIQRDETGATTHPDDLAALEAATAPDAGPLTKAAAVAATPVSDGPPTATETARLNASLEPILKGAEKQRLQAESELEAADARVQEQREQESVAQRLAMLDTILADPDVRDPVSRFDAELKRAGYQGEFSRPSPDELKHVKRFQDVRAAIEQEHIDEGTPAGTPNEMDVASLVKEKRPAGGENSTQEAGKPKSLPADLIPAATAAKGLKDGGATQFFEAAKKWARQQPGLEGPALMARRAELMRAYKAFVPPAQSERGTGQPDSGAPQLSPYTTQPAPETQRQAAQRPGNGGAAKASSNPTSPATPLAPVQKTAASTPRTAPVAATIQPAAALAPVPSKSPMQRVAEQGREGREGISARTPSSSPRRTDAPAAESSRTSDATGRPSPQAVAVSAPAQAQSSPSPAQLEAKSVPAKTQSVSVSNTKSVGASGSAGLIQPGNRPTGGNEQSTRGGGNERGAAAIQPANDTAASATTVTGATNAIQPTPTPVSPKGASRPAGPVSGVSGIPRTNPSDAGGAARATGDDGRAVVGTDAGVAAAGGKEPDALKAAHETLVKSKGQITGPQRGVINAVVVEAKKVREATAPLTTAYVKSLREKADTIAKWDTKAADAVRVLADHVDGLRPKSKMELAKIERDKAKAPTTRFEASDQNTNAAERDLRSRSRKEERPGDVMLGNEQFIDFDAAMGVMREMVAANPQYVRDSKYTAPAQLGFRLDIAPRDWTRMVDAFNAQPKGDEPQTLHDTPLLEAAPATKQEAPEVFGTNPNALASAARVTPQYDSRGLRTDIRGGANAKSSDVGHKRSSSGDYIGAPDWVGSSPQKLAYVRSLLRRLAKDGEVGRYWYEQSSRAILKFVGGDKAAAEKFVALIAIYSPNNAVAGNTTAALLAWYQWKAGVPIHAAMGAADLKATNLLYKGEMWGGVKTNSFYQNLMVEIDPSKLDEGSATMDMWMALAFDYGSKTVDQGPKYRFMERETQRLARELGWDAHQVQAAIWTGMKGRIDPIRPALKEQELKLGIGEMYEDKGKQKYRVIKGREYDHFRLAHKMGMAWTPAADHFANAAYDFSNALQERSAQMSWEATPSSDVGKFPELLTASPSQQAEYAIAIDAALRDPVTGADLVAEKLGILAAPSEINPSAWRGEVGMGAQQQTPIAFTPGQGGAKRSVSDLSRQALNLWAAVRGLVLQQDGVYWHFPVFEASRKNQNAAQIMFRQPLSVADTRVLYKAISDLAGHTDWAPAVRGREVRILNFTDVTNDQFHSTIDAALASLPERLSGAVVAGFKSDGEAVENDWKEHPNGELYAQTLRAAGRSDVLDWATTTLADAVRRVDETFAQKYGWTLPARAESAARQEVAPKGAALAAEADTAHPTSTPLDWQLYEQAAHTDSIKPLLERIVLKGSTPLNRVIARALIKSGINPEIRVADKYEEKPEDLPANVSVHALSAMYTPTPDGRGKIALFDAASAEHDTLHEGIHASTYSAINKGGISAVQANALYQHVLKFGTFDKDAYGLTNVHEFVAEAFSNEAFQTELKAIPAIRGIGGTAWDWFVRIVRNILGLHQNASNALSQVLEVGYALMQEGKGINGGGALASATRDQTKMPAFAKWFGDSKVVDADGAPRVMYHGTGADLEVFAGRKGGRPGLHSQGIWFTGKPAGDMSASTFAEYSDGNPSVYPVYLSIKNPKGIGQSQAHAWTVDELKAEGYDGAHDLETGWWIAFDSAQVKSAVGNSGAFDPANPSILASVNPTAWKQAGINAVGKATEPKTVVPDFAKGYTQAQQDTLRKVGLVHEEPTLAGRAKEMMDGFRKSFVQGMVDQYAPLKDLDKQAYMKARMSTSSDGALEAALMYGVPVLDEGGAVDVKINQGGGFLDAMKKLNGEHDRFFAWIAGNRAAQLKEKGKENLLTDDDISFLKNLNTGPMADGRARSMAYAEAFATLRKFNKAVLDIAQGRGLIDAESRPIWESEFYVPFYRNIESGASGPTKKSGLVNQQAFKTLKGGTDNLNDLFHNTLMNWSHLLSASAKNDAAKAALQAAEQAGIAIEADEATIRQMGKAANTKAVSYMDEGVRRWYTVSEPEVMDAIAALEWGGFGPMMKPFQLFKRLLSFGVTITPTYKMANIMRDTISAIGTTPIGYNPLKNVADGWKATQMGSQTYVSMLAGGGMMRFGTSLEGDRAQHVKNMVNAGIDDKQVLDTKEKVKALGQKIWDAYQEFGDRAENMNRGALYQQLRDKGMSHAEASYMARDMMDFSLQGKWAAVRFLTQTVPFMNARLQGLYKLGRASKEDRARFAAVVGAVSAVSLALMWMQGDDDDWKKREEWDRNNYWFVKIGGIAFYIPKPFEIGAIGTLAERSWELMFDKDMSGSRYMNNVGTLVANNFSMAPMPQLLKPLMDVYSNKESFTGRAIETMGMERLQPQDRSKPGTTEVAKLLSQIGVPEPGQMLMGQYKPLSPVQWDALMRGYFGSLAVGAGMVTDAIMRPLLDRPTRPDMTLGQYPLIGRFVKDLPQDQSRYVTQFYDEAAKIEEAYASYRDALKRGDSGRAQEVLADNRDKIARHNATEAAKRNMSIMNRQLKAIADSTTMTGAEKRDRIEQIRANQDRIARSTVRQ